MRTVINNKKTERLSLLMKLFIITLLGLFTSSSFAHVEEGKYTGKLTDGSECSFESLGTSFENNTPHPLNERVQIKFNGVEYTLSHPAVVNSSTGEVSFNHDLLQSVVPTKKGAQAFIIHMIHTPEKEGPASFEFLTHEWKANLKTSIICNDLTFSTL